MLLVYRVFVRLLVCFFDPVALCVSSCIVFQLTLILSAVALSAFRAGGSASSSFNAYLRPTGARLLTIIELGGMWHYGLT